MPRGMVIVDDKTFWIFRCDDFSVKVIAKYWYWEKAGYILKDCIFQLLNFPVSFLTTGMASLRSIPSWHPATST